MPLMPSVVTKILSRLGYPSLINAFSEKVTSSELNSLLLEIFDQKVSKVTPPQLLNLYQLNRFVKPADLPVLELRRVEIDLLEIFTQYSFELLELSPVAALGSCSVVASVDQKKVLSALRGTEVLADATNSIALHFADLKQKKIRAPFAQNENINFATIQRHIRTQAISGKGFTPHFKIACLVTCGSDSGSYTFEKQSLRGHIALMIAVYRNYYKVEDLKFRFLCRAGYKKPLELAAHVRDFVMQTHPEIVIDIIEKPEKEINYYKGIQYKVDIRVKEKWYEIGDGGFVDWTQQLLQNKKERMLSTGIGFEFMYRILKGDV